MGQVGGEPVTFRVTPLWQSERRPSGSGLISIGLRLVGLAPSGRTEPAVSVCPRDLFHSPVRATDGNMAYGMAKLGVVCR